MFEVAELGHKLSKQKFKQRVPSLRTELLQVQQQLLDADFPVLLLISGVDGGGKGDVTNVLHEWMDPRYIRTHAFDAPNEEERARPPYWRYWMAMPAKGQLGIFVGSWYSDPIAKRVTGEYKNAQLDASLLHVNELEKELCDDGALIIKCWIHLGKVEQKRRFKQLKKDPATAWRVTKRDIEHLKSWDSFVGISERVLRETSTGHAPWLIVDGSDLNYTKITVATHIVTRIKDHLAQREDQKKKIATKLTASSVAEEMSVLDSLDLGKSLGKRQYNSELEKYQGQLNSLAREARLKKVSSILVFEGWDAGGKGGAIRRIARSLDARQYRVIPVTVPTDEEKAHHYLWRFWRHLPRAGQISMYDRSWYGRVLVERVEKFATQDEWMRAYTEINDFEEELVDFGIVVLKYWMHIDSHEQLKRFKEREKISYKKYKITEEDYRNRDKAREYIQAVNDMVTRTSTSHAPWHLVEGNDKRFARVKVIKTFCEALEKALQDPASV